LNDLGIADYQTKPNPDRYSETKPKPLTLELLWILRPLLDAADLTYLSRTGCALGEHGKRLAESFGKVAEEHYIRERLSQVRERLPQESTASGKTCGGAQGSASDAGEAAFPLPSGQ
jgi:hypothetical protein